MGFPTCITKIPNIQTKNENLMFLDDSYDGKDYRYWFILDSKKIQKVEKLSNNQSKKIDEGTWNCDNDTLKLVLTDGKKLKFDYNLKYFVADTSSTTTEELSAIEKELFKGMKAAGITVDKAKESIDKLPIFPTQEEKDKEVEKYKKYLQNPPQDDTTSSTDGDYEKMFKAWFGKISDWWSDLGTVPVTLPSWIPDCLKKRGVFQATHNGKPLPDQAMLQTDTDKEYFFDDKFYVIVNKKTKERIEGKWKCEGGKLVIDLENGDRYEDGKGWKYDHTRPSSSSTQPVLWTSPQQQTTSPQQKTTQIKPEQPEDTSVGPDDI